MIGTRAIVLTVIALALGALRLGYGWGSSAREWQVKQVTNEKVQVEAALAICQRVSEDNARNLIAVRETLARELAQRQAQQRAQADELTARDKRIAALAAAARARNQSLQQAAADDQCAALRDLPVCAAVADRLWGGHEQ